MIAKGILKISSGTVPHEMMQEAWCTSSNLEASYSLHVSELVNYGISKYNTSYEETVERSEEMIVTHPSNFICYHETRFQLTQKLTSTNTKIERTLHASEGDTGEVLPGWYKCNCTAVVGYKAMGESLPLMIVFQGPVPVVDKYQWPHISGFPAVV